MKTRLKQLRQGVVIGLAVWGGLAGQVQAGEPVEVFSFGEARLQEPLPYQFHLPNHGEDVLEMRSATPSCDCIKIEEWTSLVEVGGTGSVQVIFTPDQAGEVDYRILVQTSDPQTPELEFAIRGTVTSPANPPGSGLVAVCFCKGHRTAGAGSRLCNLGRCAQCRRF